MTEADFEKLLKKTISPAKVRDSLVGSAYLSDGTLLLGANDEELAVHKAFLMTASPVFLCLFSQMTDPNHQFRIKGISRETMIEICRYAYTEQVKLNTSNMLTLFEAAKGLQMKFLMEKIVNFICKEGMNEVTVFMILEANRSENNFSINMKCFEYIEKNYQKCLRSSDFLLLSPDDLRNILKTCKRIPQLAAKEAIAMWSAQIDNKDEDLDELIALMSLHEEVHDEPKQNDQQNGDTESLASAHSRARSIDTRKGFSKQQKGIFQQNFHGSTPNLDQNPNRQRNNNNRNNNRQNGPPQDQFLVGIYTNMMQRQGVQRSTSMPPYKNIFFSGRILRKNRQFSNLDLKVLATPIAIHALHFVYDLRSTDTFFKIEIFDVSSTFKKTPLWYEMVSIKGQGPPYFIYTLQRPCNIPAGSKIWISIDFGRSEHRISLENFAITAGMDRVDIRDEKNDGQQQKNAQVISSITFVDC